MTFSGGGQVGIGSAPHGYATAGLFMGEEYNLRQITQRLEEVMENRVTWTTETERAMSGRTAVAAGTNVRIEDDN